MWKQSRGFAVGDGDDAQFVVAGREGMAEDSQGRDTGGGICGWRVPNNQPAAQSPKQGPALKSDDRRKDGRRH